MAARARKTTNTKKVTRKTRSKKTTADVVDMPVSSETTEMNTVRKNRLPLIIGLILLLALLYYFRGLFVAAIVNGQPITRMKVIQNLEAQSGQQILDDIVTKTLVEQEAKKKNIKVTEEEIKTEIATIEQSFASQEGGQSLDDLLSAQGMSREDLNDRIRFQKLAEKLLEGSIEVTDDEIKSYINENKQFFAEGTSEDDMKTTAREQLKQQKLNDKFQELLGNLRNDAKVRYFVNYQ